MASTQLTSDQLTDPGNVWWCHLGTAESPGPPPHPFLHLLRGEMEGGAGVPGRARSLDRHQSLLCLSPPTSWQETNILDGNNQFEMRQHL